MDAARGNFEKQQKLPKQQNGGEPLSQIERRLSVRRFEDSAAAGNDSDKMTTHTLYTALFTYLLVLFCVLPFAESGILKIQNHGRHDEEAVQTLLAVGLIAKALSDMESKQPKCPPQVTKVIHVPMHHHTEKVYVVKEKDEEAWASENKHIWKKPSIITSTKVLSKNTHI
ncbi:hypothetical protein JTE90_001358 [Oedothorax gibbosus]|uniref:Uncharacterized protein n=1 Tax=Oedothorax gibbosus TaxID=931172 RepID=A0AAV6VGZ3_9ARAC|nr:hypothetical protein JTE90_001358 [Oedothorax gibbosus]